MAANRLSFIYPREYPALPDGYDWETQKELYCPKDLLTYHLPGHPTLSTRLGYVFCHRGLYERSSAIVDNSPGAIANGIREGFHLHEVDAFIWDKLERSFISHDKNPRRFTSKTEPWTNYSLDDILHTFLVTRRFNRETLDVASSYLGTEDTVPGLLGSLWNELLKPKGRTMQIDLREEDFAMAIPYLCFHIRKWRSMQSRPTSVENGLFWSLTKTTMLKGYNFNFTSFGHLHQKIREYSIAVYGEIHFGITYLPLLPPLIMVFYPGPLVKLAEETPPSDGDSATSRRSYDHLYRTLMNQVMSYVDIGKDKYNFILEIVHSGLGLGYNKETKKATDPRNGKPLDDDGVIFDSLLDRVMIDVSVDLRARYPELIFSSCTRLADVITPNDGDFKASWITSKLIPIETGEKGLAAKLAAIHGGLYPQSHLVVADDPAAEIAARTWIDQKSDLDRSHLLHTTYDKWLAGAEDSVVAAITALNNRPFAANMVGDPEQAEPWIPSFPNAGSSAETAKATESSNEGTGGVDDGDRPVFRDSDSEAAAEDDEWDNDSTENETPVALSLGGRFYKLMSEAQAKHLPSTLVAQAHKAARFGDITLLLDLLPNIPVDDETGPYGTMLAAACAEGHTEIAALLLDAEANINTAGHSGQPLYLAAKCGQLDVFKLLVQRGAKPFRGLEKSRLWVPVLPAACEGEGEDHLEMIRILLEMGADVQEEGNYGTAIEAASLWGSVDNVDLILRYYTVEEIGAGKCKAALKEACMEGHKDVVKRLLKEGIRPGPLLGEPEAAAVLAEAELEMKGPSVGDQRQAGMTQLTTGLRNINISGVDDAQERMRVAEQSRIQRELNFRRRREARRRDDGDRRRVLMAERRRRRTGLEELILDQAITPCSEIERKRWMSDMRRNMTRDTNRRIASEGQEDSISCSCLLCRIEQVIQTSVSPETAKEIRRNTGQRDTWPNNPTGQPLIKVVKDSDFQELLGGEPRYSDN